MSINTFIDSAIKLYENEYYDTSLCLVCMALGRCAKDRYPNLAVGKRYKQFIVDNFSVICQRGFPGISASSIRIKINATVENLKLDRAGYVGMEDIIYHVIRADWYMIVKSKSLSILLKIQLLEIGTIIVLKFPRLLYGA